MESIWLPLSEWHDQSTGHILKHPEYTRKTNWSYMTKTTSILNSMFTDYNIA